MKFSETKVKKSNNLQIMRFIAAIMVMFAHSYAISGSDLKSDFIYRNTNGIISIGGISVTLFFLCSGYLISKSIFRTDKFITYIKARLIRLLPPLWFVVVLSVVIGAFITSLSFAQYFGNINTYKYLLNGIMLPVHNLPGVFEINKYGATVNGSLWTLPVEFACYVACYVFYKLKFLDKKRFFYTIPIVVLAILFENKLPGIFSSMVRPCVFFYIGMLYYVYREHIVLNIKIVPILVALLVFSYFVPFFIKPAMILLWPYILFTVWFAIPQCSDRVGIAGDISYGVYLWGFVVQQILSYAFGGEMPQMLNFALATIITVALATITFMLTEKPFLKKKN